MIVIESLDQIGAAERGSVGALGNFDGVHRGHRTVLERTRTIAEGAGAPVAVGVPRSTSTGQLSPKFFFSAY